ncbi:MAG: fructose-bisphosphate aldolase [Firmicutes bacterium]|nr:fructose-bisphosphate aldolase [Bacillota bacterium]
MSIGKAIRMARLFRSKTKRLVLITLDHGICIKPMKGLEDTKAIVRAAAEGGADAVLVTPGIAKHTYEELAGKIPFMLRIDGTATSIGPDLTNDRLICSVEEALRLGADAVATFGVIGVPREAELAEKNGRAGELCDLWGMPMMTEMIPPEILTHQFETKASRKWPSDPEVVKFSARVAAELGADIVKGYYTGDPETFREVVKYCPVPYVVLSGPASDDPEVLLKFIREAIDCGAAGVSMGRNIWESKNPVALIKAICSIVHNDVSAEAALRELS